MIEFVLLDLDDTLLDFGRAEAVALADTLRRIGVEPTEATVSRYSAINRAQWELLELGQLTRTEVKLRRFQLLFDELGVNASAEESKSFYENRLAIGHYFMPGAEELLRTLRGRYRLFIVSNGTTAVQQGRIASAGIEPFFERIFLSEQIGAVKPDRTFFDACFAEIDGFDPARAIIVGDSLTSDVLGGINAGIRTCWFNPHGKAARVDIHPDYTIASLEALPALLQRL